MPSPRFHPLVRLLICAGGLLAISGIVAVVLLLGDQLATNLTGRPSSESVADLALRNILPLTLLTYPASLLWIALCRVQFDKRSFTSLGLHGRRAFPDALRGGVAGFLAIALLWGILWLCGAITVGGWSPEAFEAGWRSLLPLFGFFLVFVAVGCFEEILFRGYALHNLRAWLGWPLALVSQAVLFAVVHLGNANGDKEVFLAALSGLPNIALIGVFFALAYKKTGSLWFPIGFHTAWNWSLGCLFSLPVSGIPIFRLLDVQPSETSWLSGGSFGAEGSLLLVPIIVAMIYFIAQLPDHPQAQHDLSLVTDEAPVPQTAPIVPRTSVAEAPDEPRDNRFRTRFGSASGFDGETLRELRELQRQREAVQRPTVQLELPATPQIEVEPLEPTSEPKVASEVPAPAPPVVAEPLIPTSPSVAPTPTETKQPEVVPLEPETSNPTPIPAPVTPPSAPQKPTEPTAPPTPPKKKPSPRW